MFDINITLTVPNPVSEEDFTNNISDLSSQRRQKLIELRGLEFHINDQRQQLQTMRVQQQQGKVQK